MTDPTIDPPGLTLNQRRALLLKAAMDEKLYELEPGEELGQGGFSSVLRGVHRNSRRRVALKILTDPDRRTLFYGEVQALEKLRGCPEVIELIDYGIKDHRWKDGTSATVMFLVLELAETSLDEELEARGHIEALEAIPILRSIADALVKAHELGVEHNDVKTSNILKVGSVWKLGDFNIARDDPLAKAWSPIWVDLAKKRWATSYPAFTSDIDQLGKVLFRMLAGAMPDDTASGGEAGKGLPKAVKAIYRGCVDPNPRYRYRSADLVADDFEEYVKKEGNFSPHRMPRLPRHVRAFRKVKAHPVLATLATVTVAVGAIHDSQVRQERHRIVTELREIQKIEAEVEDALEHAQEPTKSPDRALDGFPASKAETSRGDEGRQRGRERAILARDGLRRMTEVRGRLGARDDAAVRALDDDFNRMNQTCRDLLEWYESHAQDRLIIDELETARLENSWSLHLIPGGNHFRSKDRVRNYLRIFHDRLGIDPGRMPFDPEAQATRLAQRPARRVYAAYLVDAMYCWGRSLVEEPLRFLNFRAENRQIQALRQLAGKVDDTDPWTRQFHGMFVSILPDKIVRQARELASIAEPTVVPHPKLTILGEVLIKNDLPAAVELLTKLQSTYPNDFWANHLLAEAFAALGDKQEIHFRHNAVNLRPKLALAHFLLGQSYVRQGHLDLAEPHFLEAIRLDGTLWKFLPDELKVKWPPTGVGGH